MYTRPAGAITVGWFKKDVTNYPINTTEVIQPGNDNGFDGQYAGYTLNTQDNGGKGQFQGLEVSIKQSLRPLLQIRPRAIARLGSICRLQQELQGRGAQPHRRDHQAARPKFL